MGKTGLAGILVFQDRIGGAIYVYDLGTDTLRPLTGGIDPAISPDGQRVAFARDGGDHGLYVINLDGSGEQRIYSERELIRSPKWSPDGRLLVFSRSHGFQDCRLLNGGVCLPDATIIESLPPELQAPDVRVEKLIRDLPNQRAYPFVLSRIAADGTDYRDVPSLTSAGAPDWGDAGIVYHSRAGIQTTADQPDTRSFEVANDPLQGYFLDPDWQPGAEGVPGRIVFHRKQGSHWQIYAVNPDGSGLVALTRPVTALVDELPSNVSPAWSPDGRTIIYLSNRSSIESAGAWHLWAMDADGANQRRLPIDVIFDYTFSSEQMVSWADVTGP
jgi:Tol biopolymer transport system component